MGAEDISILEKFNFDSYRGKFTNRSDLQPPWGGGGGYLGHELGTGVPLGLLIPTL